jgi:hypothetical protein
MRIRCCLCGALIAASVVEVLNSSTEHNVCEVVHDCAASVEYGLPPQPHMLEYDDSEQLILIRDSKAFRGAGSPETWLPINLRFDDTFEMKDSSHADLRPL